jgi:hypothetical protein
MKLTGFPPRACIRQTLPPCQRPINSLMATAAGTGAEKPAAGDANPAVDGAKAVLASAKGAVAFEKATAGSAKAAATFTKAAIAFPQVTTTFEKAAVTFAKVTVTPAPVTAGFRPFSSKTSHFRLKPRFQPLGTAVWPLLGRNWQFGNRNQFGRIADARAGVWSQNVSIAVQA